MQQLGILLQKRWHNQVRYANKLYFTEFPLLKGVYTEDLPSIRMRQLKAMTAAVRNAILKGKDLTLANKNGVTPVSQHTHYYWTTTGLLLCNMITWLRMKLSAISND